MLKNQTSFELGQQCRRHSWKHKGDGRRMALEYGDISDMKRHRGAAITRDDYNTPYNTPSFKSPSILQSNVKFSTPNPKDDLPIQHLDIQTLSYQMPVEAACKPIFGIFRC